MNTEADIIRTDALNIADMAAKRIARLECDLEECREYLEKQMDVVDGSYGEPAPNRAMQLVWMIDQTLNGVAK